jgi:glycine/D-amino acid oxidase-like deaminating enzyme
MDLVSGSPWWPLSAGLIRSWPPLDAPVRVDVAVIGAGITGALVADALADAGASVVVLDRRDVATGSTAASTGLLQFELDTELAELIPMAGERAAVRAWQMSVEAIGGIERLAAALDCGAGFARRQSLYLATDRRSSERLQREAEVRQAHGLPSEFLSRKQLREFSSVPAHGAIRSAAGGEVDPYRLTHALLTRAADRGARIHDRTEVTGYEDRERGVRLATSRGYPVEAGRVVLALGYEIPPMLRADLVTLTSTYALVTEPVESFRGWEGREMMWEGVRPYTYLRTTPDGRILVGGEDVPFRDPQRRDRLLRPKAKRLAQRMRRMLPDIPAEPAFAWTGTFGETRDGLPYVGESPEFPHGLFALGYGGNGITFGYIAAEILCDLCLGRPNDDAWLYRLDRASGGPGGNEAGED